MNISKTIKTTLFAAALLPCLVRAQAALHNDEDLPIRTVIHAGHMLDVKTGRMIENVTVVIQGDKILSIGPLAVGNPPAGMKEIVAVLVDFLKQPMVRRTARTTQEQFACDA